MKEFKMFVKEMIFCVTNPILKHGWGNGYVVIPEGHFLHGVYYDGIAVQVHGGLTFSRNAVECLTWAELPEGSENGWVVGFDTSHLGDSISKWPKDAVLQETENLMQQLINYKEE